MRDPGGGDRGGQGGRAGVLAVDGGRLRQNDRGGPPPTPPGRWGERRRMDGDLLRPAGESQRCGTRGGADAGPLGGAPRPAGERRGQIPPARAAPAPAPAPVPMAMPAPCAASHWFMIQRSSAPPASVYPSTTTPSRRIHSLRIARSPIVSASDRFSGSPPPRTSTVR